MKVSTRIEVTVTLEAHEQFKARSATGDFMCDTIMAHYYSDGLRTEKVDLSGQHIKADGTPGLFRRYTTIPFVKLPTKLQPGIPARYVEGDAA